MLVTLYSDAKEAQSEKEGYYFLQTDPVNEKPCWFNEGGYAIWANKAGGWEIGNKRRLGSNLRDLFSKDVVEDPLQSVTWQYWNGDTFIKSKDILVTRTGNL